MSKQESRPAPLDISLHRKQGIAFESEATEILYGGAVGGGKSFLMRAAAIVWCAQIPGLQVYLFRRLRDDLVKNHIEGPKGLRMLLIPWSKAGLVTIVEDEIRFWNGSKIYLCHCKDEKDRYKYLGSEISLLLIDELTTFTETIYRFLRSRCRMVGLTLPPELAGKFPRIICGSNPGNAGHAWVKAAFIDRRPSFEIERMPEEEGGMLRQYIPAKLDDNPSMAADDPGYGAKVSGLGSPELVRAMRDGDWNVIAGAFFPEISSQHIIKPRSLPAYWMKFRSFDWGSARPFSVGWWTVSDGELAEFPRGAIIRYREWYGAKRDSGGRTIPNTGLRMTAEQVADGIIERERGDVTGNRTMGGVADPSIFHEDGGPSIADRMASRKVYWRAADNSRVGKLGAMGGWDQVRARLIGDGERPALYVFDTCVDWVRTMPALQHDEGRPEDVQCWVAGTKVSTPAGDRPIEEIMPGDLVDTPIGPRPVLKSHRSGMSHTVIVTLSDGRILEGTPDHKIVIKGLGLVALADLSCHTTPVGRITWSRSLNIAVSSIVATMGAVTTIRRRSCFAKEAVRAFIGRYGSMLGVRYRPAGISTISMAISTTTNSTISSVCPRAIMPRNTSQSEWPALSGAVRLNGWRQKPDGRFSATTPGRWWSERRNGNLRASIVGLLSLLSIPGKGFARTSVASNTICRSSLFAQFVGMILPRSAAIQSKRRPAHISAVGNSDVSVPVYNLTVADAHLFYANGVLSSNTDAEDHVGDECRYACLSRPYVAPLPPDSDPHEPDRYARRWKPARRARGSAMSA